MITQCRRLAFVAFDLGSFHPVHGIAPSDRIAFQEVIKEAGQRCEFASDRGSSQTALLELGAPGQDMRPGDHTKLIGRSQTNKSAEVFQIILVGASCPRVVQVGKLLDGRRYPSQRLKFDRRESALFVWADLRQFLHNCLSFDSD